MPGCFIFRRGRRRCGYGQECRGECGNCSFPFPTAPTPRFPFDSFSPFSLGEVVTSLPAPLLRAVPARPGGGAEHHGKGFSRRRPGPQARLAAAGEEAAARGSERVGQAGEPDTDQAGHGLRVLPAAARCLGQGDFWVGRSESFFMAFVPRLSRFSFSPRRGRAGAQRVEGAIQKRRRETGWGHGGVRDASPGLRDLSLLPVWGRGRVRKPGGS